MRFGLSFLPDCSPGTRSATDYYDDVLGLSRMAEQAGLHYVKMTEHYLHPYGGYCPSPLTFLAAVAAQTTRIRLMTGCVLPVFHHPIQLASHISMVDALSDGRVEVGFARAYLPYEFSAFQVPMDGSRARFEATVNAVHRLLTEEHVDEDTPFFAFQDATVLPRPVQRPRPPFWVAAVQTPASFVRIGELGHGLLITPSGTSFDPSLVDAYRQSFLEHHPDRQPRVAASVPVLVADTDQEARRIADPYLSRYLEVWSSALTSWDSTASTDYADYTGSGHRIGAMTAKDMRVFGSAVVGSPEQVVDRIGRFQQDVRADVLLLQTDFGGLGGSEARRSLDAFVSSVMPKLAGEYTGPAADEPGSAARHEGPTS
ncbi:LLM class flavin-dependent oxidoreductase [Streptomyces sp. PTM05]|uniref:LLM class flavin-dependent oxidoreductase n=1 Tax=Streptantibioticus parmotrematis TaxID=2873249 RepID=A0ABS7QP95_9ACTN|nr:LLM class flavin-dependent oxidoreductase [Streptantibioticus parmotrematis]MBY8883682.1 LLM class flavin-dependent oxidoreductase [Streptantibioticus parmotrematis]